MTLTLIGVNHKTAPIELRERIAISRDDLPETIRALAAVPGVTECMIVSTCNRVEILAAIDSSDVELSGFLSRYFGLNPAVLGPHIYEHRDQEAVRHLFRVAASLDSMVVGEPQILGQVKEAFAVARASGTVGGQLDHLLQSAFAAAKKVRSETEIGANSVSIASVAVELARKIFGSLNNRTVMIVGAGKMSELAARHLRRSGCSHVFVTNRTHQRAVDMAKLFQGTPVEYTRFTAMLPEVDILIASSGAPHYILHKDEMQRVISARRNKPMFLIDIAVPRNIEPSINDLDNVFLYDIDDLQEVVNSNLRERMKEADHAETLVAEEVERTMARLKVAEVTPIIVSLQEQLEQIRSGEIEKQRRRLGPLTAQQEEALEALTHGIINKIAHGPISELRSHAGKPEGAHVIATIRKAFHLQD
jgi:glutamyl-tRNA reductase